MKDNNLLILDEPSNHLDDHSTKVLCDLISEKEKRSAIILVSHDPRLLDNLDVNNEIIIKDDKIFNKNEIIDNHQVDLVEINKKPIKKNIS
jgi:ATPase subunit of ABC transporter with duplicated ATPase domains